MHAVPRFLWNAKMRFGKTFTTYQLAKKLGAKRVLVVTFKPAVEDAWQTDLENHVDFDGWQYLSRNSDSDPTRIDAQKPVVYFGSFPDLLRRGVARHGEGTVRGRGRGGREARGQARIRRRSGGRERRPQHTLGERDRVPADHDQGIPLSLWHAVQGAGDGRVYRGTNLQLDVHRRAARQGGVRHQKSRQVESLRRAAADAPTDVPDAGRTGGNCERWGVR